MKLQYAVMLAVLAALWLAACSSDSNTNTAPKIDLGSEVFLYGGKTVTFVASDEEALVAFAKAHAANDQAGFEELRLSGRLISVPNGTKALVIDRGGFGAIRVRILTGDYKGRAVWTDEAWVRTSPAAPAR